MRCAKDGVGMGKAVQAPLYRRWWRKESRKSWEHVTQHDPVLTHARGHVYVDSLPPPQTPTASKYNHESFDEWWYIGGMRAIHIPPLTPTPRELLDRLYRTTKVPRLRTRAQMILLAAEQGLKVPQIAPIVRESEATVLRWLKRYRAEGIEG
jgi:hypothetical protein